VAKQYVGKVKIFSLKELENATYNFNTKRILEKGGQTTVYEDDDRWNNYCNEKI